MGNVELAPVNWGRAGEVQDNPVPAPTALKHTVRVIKINFQKNKTT